MWGGGTQRICPRKVGPHLRLSDVVEAANAPREHPQPVVWSDYWPENARVPRVNPNEVEA
ncbi:hypothetical protein PAN31117_03144 [Pandoraea anapnoica]|uniref:Uncharacterized protein n=1 Tax=Pandoraea anapnoica TaxID=2508301 RepID=A0A5E5A9Z1_9BURK|nr:hypothetical protein PAN31117_03144 [Pandoraea anapnoica]